MTDLAQGAAARRGTWHDDLPVAAVAALTAALVWLAARAGGLDLEVHSGSGARPVGVVSVLVTCVVVTLVGGALLRAMMRRLGHGLRWWTVSAVAVLVVSLLGPLSAVSLGAGLVLTAMHLAVGAVVVVGLRRRALP